jgi:hypothetical protein
LTVVTLFIDGPISIAADQRNARLPRHGAEETFFELTFFAATIPAPQQRCSVVAFLRSFAQTITAYGALHAR